ncbi:MAG: MerR family transcriptional regulator, partial [Pseudolabrys sp.]|nr:MerR family transcriptional regulator [Pseudolabrys sp.]
GRRFYRPDDIDLLRGIRHLLYGEGYTIRGVQRILREQGIDFVQSVWQEGAAPVPADDEDVDADEAIETEEEDDTEEVEERRGLRDRIGSLIGRDFSEGGHDDGERQEPPMQSTPMPRIDPGERIFASPAAAERHIAFEPAPRAEPPREPPVQPAVVSAMPADKLERLKAVLDELKECRSRIDAALTPATK